MVAQLKQRHILLHSTLEVLHNYSSVVSQVSCCQSMLSLFFWCINVLVLSISQKFHAQSILPPVIDFEQMSCGKVFVEQYICNIKSLVLCCSLVSSSPTAIVHITYSTFCRSWFRILPVPSKQKFDANVCHLLLTLLSTSIFPGLFCSWCYPSMYHCLDSLISAIHLSWALQDQSPPTLPVILFCNQKAHACFCIILDIITPSFFLFTGQTSKGLK